MQSGQKCSGVGEKKFFHFSEKVVLFYQADVKDVVDVNLPQRL